MVLFNLIVPNINDLMMHCNYTKVFFIQFNVLNLLPVFAGFTVVLLVFPLSWQKYFLLWQKLNPGSTC